tara:strand:+ start:114 stop:551 length:438 start_codon:yes stop_codon:yes gene_type:complete
MKPFLIKTKYLLFFFLFIDIFQLRSEEFSFSGMPNNQNQILIESNIQSTDLENSIFYAEGDVKITNTDKEFIAKSNKAIFYKSSAKIKLIGNVEVITSDSSRINAGEILYYLKDDRFEAISNLDERVYTKFVFDEKKSPYESKDK